MDKIIVEELEVYAYHGVHLEEKKLGQLFIVSIQVEADLELAATNDDLSNTISYSHLCSDVEHALKEKSYDLIEAAAMAVINRIFENHSKASSVKVLLKKPWAPLGRHLKYAAVEIERKRETLKFEEKTTAYIGIGSNMGDRQVNLDTAVDLLNNTNGIEVKKISSFYNTPPVGFIEQPDFLNGAVEIETRLSPRELLEKCHEIEEKLKRVRTVTWGPRTIDLDILFFGNMVICENDLIIPHPYMTERDFVLKPMNQIASNVVHPILKMTVSELYKNFLKMINHKF